MNSPFVSVCLVTYRRTKLFENTLRSLKLQNYPRDKIEVIVIDNNPNDFLRKTVRKLSDDGLPIRYLHRPFESISTICSERLKVARGDIIVLLDDDFILEPNFMINLVKKLKEGYDIVAYRIIDPYLKGRSKLGPNSTLIPVLNHQDAEMFTKYGFWRRLSENLYFDTYFEAGYVDIDFWLTAKERGAKATLAHDAVAYHVGKDSVTVPRFGKSYYRLIIRERLYFHFKHYPPRGIRSWLGFCIWELRLLLREIKGAIFQRDRFPLGLIWGFLFERIRFIKDLLESRSRESK